MFNKTKKVIAKCGKQWCGHRPLLLPKTNSASTFTSTCTGNHLLLPLFSNSLKTGLRLWREYDKVSEITAGKYIRKSLTGIQREVGTKLGCFFMKMAALGICRVVTRWCRALISTSQTASVSQDRQGKLGHSFDESTQQVTEAEWARTQENL